MDADRLLDDVSWRLLGELQEHARLTYSELGRRVGLTPPAVAERIRRLEEAGIITGYRVTLNPEKVGFPLTAFIRISLVDGKCAHFSAVTRELPEVVECHHVTGEDDYVLKVVVPSVRHLEAFLERLRPYGETTTSIVLSSPVTHRVLRPSPTERSTVDEATGMPSPSV